MQGQISLYDLISENVEMGHVGKENIGCEIPFAELKNFINKKVIYCTPSKENGLEVVNDGRIVIIKDYYDKCDTFYSIEKEDGQHFFNNFYYGICRQEEKKLLKKAFVCDRIGYVAGQHTKKADSWISEAYCKSGRHQSNEYGPKVGFYKYKP